MYIETFDFLKKEEAEQKSATNNTFWKSAKIISPFDVIFQPPEISSKINHDDDELNFVYLIHLEKRNCNLSHVFITKYGSWCVRVEY